MIRRAAIVSATLLTAVGFGGLPASAEETQARVAPVLSCAALAAVDLDAIGGDGSMVTSAQEAESNGRRTCTVNGILAPAIRFQVNLPVDTWTGRYLQVGCGGLCGRVSLTVGAADGCVPLTNGAFVVGGTDMGHDGMGGAFGRDPQARADFAHRGVHLTALAAKTLIRAFYGRDPAHSYFNGCSDGGREALMEAQRYPDDFDGIIAGAAAMNFQVQNGIYHAWMALSNTGPDGKAIVTADRLPLIHRAVLDACDGLDGQVDGLVSDPRGCTFNPATLACPDETSTGATDCLSEAEAEAVRRFYDGPVDAATGTALTAGQVQFGSELAWAGVFVPDKADQPIFSSMIAMEALPNLIFEDGVPDGFKLSDLRFDLATFERLKARHPLLDATNPDLSAFVKRGGKLIVWHGWADPHISPVNAIAYHEALIRTLGADTVAGFERLYLLPGVHHCEGGEGPSAIDLLTPMLAWVETGVAPDAIVARQPAAGQGPTGFGAPAGAAGPIDGGSGTAGPQAAPAPAASAGDRPVFPYPAIAVFGGSGDVNDAAAYRRSVPAHVAPVPTWAGSGFFEPYSFRAE